jgi:hypothetical protein
VEEIRPAADALHDPRLDALETAAVLVGATDPDELLEAVVSHAHRAIGAAWSAVVSLDDGEVLASEGDIPAAGWLVAFVEGSQASARGTGGRGEPLDVVWSPLPSAGLAMIVGRDGTAYRARERRQVAALARIVDTRLREVQRAASRRAHPSSMGR